MPFTQQELLAELHRLVQTAEAKGIHLRAIGGLAVRLHYRDDHPAFKRDYPDLDFVVARKQRREFEAFMTEAGYSPNKQFNLLNGAHRQIYFQNDSELKVDIFVGDFEMCHKIPLEDRLTADPLTIPLAELLLSKAQVVEINKKDLLDLTSLLLFNETGDDDSRINLTQLARLCSADWGLYKTISLNLDRVADLTTQADSPLTDSERAAIRARCHEILKTFEAMPKPLAWQLRDRVGTRVRWYEEVEEVAR
ncbi:MAG: nucleotidyltransferase family protein [Chloroflexi bacterium]|nr:nucleotidyltransferase family protein [Chloroflexota bacterium]